MQTAHPNTINLKLSHQHHLFSVRTITSCCSELSHSCMPSVPPEFYRWRIYSWRIYLYSCTSPLHVSFTITISIVRSKRFEEGVKDSQKNSDIRGRIDFFHFFPLMNIYYIMSIFDDLFRYILYMRILPKSMSRPFQRSIKSCKHSKHASNIKLST